MSNIKYVILMLLLSSCGKWDFYKVVGKRKFKVGDCLVQSHTKPESWESATPEFIILELGKNNYRAKSLEYNYATKISYGHLDEGFYQKVRCKDGK